MRTAVAVSISALWLAAPSPARADVGPPPDECVKKKEGEACKSFDGRPGACGMISYTKTFPPPSPDLKPTTSQQTYFGCRAGQAPTLASDGGGKRCSVASVGASARGGVPLALAACALAAGAARARRRAV